MTTRLEQACLERGLRMSEQRRIILQVIDQANDHPCAEEVHRRVIRVEPTISMATVYRTLNILAEAGIISRVELGDGKTHYEDAGDGRHEHLVDVESGQVLEFRDHAIEALLREAAGRLGYRLLQYRLEVFATAEARVSSSEEPMRDQHHPEIPQRQQIEPSRSAVGNGSASYQPSAALRRRPVKLRNKVSAAAVG